MWPALNLQQMNIKYHCRIKAELSRPHLHIRLFFLGVRLSKMCSFFLSSFPLRERCFFRASKQLISQQPPAWCKTYAMCKCAAEAEWPLHLHWDRRVSSCDAKKHLRVYKFVFGSRKPQPRFTIRRGSTQKQRVASVHCSNIKPFNEWILT